ncbi:MAG TPA: hypothetical protein VFM21_09310, partial [Terriglobia bacterium]|nr:hypothetical protein [Terriglobia bacterium]
MSNLGALLEPVFEHAAFRHAMESIASNRREAQISGLTRTAKALVIAGLAHRLRRPLVVWTGENETADELCQATRTFLIGLEGKA